jgi:hypothetical protein
MAHFSPALPSGPGVSLREAVQPHVPKITRWRLPYPLGASRYRNTCRWHRRPPPRGCPFGRFDGPLAPVGSAPSASVESFASGSIASRVGSKATTTLRVKTLLRRSRVTGRRSAAKDVSYRPPRRPVVRVHRAPRCAPLTVAGKTRHLRRRSGARRALRSLNAIRGSTCPLRDDSPRGIPHWLHHKRYRDQDCARRMG